MKSTEDIIIWSNKLSAWKQDALRRLATSSPLASGDHTQIMQNLKLANAFPKEGLAADEHPLLPEHLDAQETASNFHIKEIGDIQGVNRLAKGAKLEFLPTGLTIVYGRNGSGKSGFVRIFRSAGRTRIEKPADLKVLGDVYDTSGVSPQKATITVHRDGKDSPIEWSNDIGALGDLNRVSVFDSAAAAVYVDSGNQIHYLPFGLSLPHRLNDLFLNLKEELEKELKPIQTVLNSLILSFPTPRNTAAQKFWQTLTAKTTDSAIDTF